MFYPHPATMSAKHNVTGIVSFQPDDELTTASVPRHKSGCSKKNGIVCMKSGTGPTTGSLGRRTALRLDKRKASTQSKNLDDRSFVPASTS